MKFINLLSSKKFKARFTSFSAKDRKFSVSDFTLGLIAGFSASVIKNLDKKNLANERLKAY